jgi:transposase
LSKGIALLERLDRIHGPKIDDANPGAACTPAAIVLDNGPVHTSKATREALAARQHWLRPERLAKYAPELNDIEHEWKTLKADRLAHRTFKNVDNLKTAIDEEIKAMNQNRKPRFLAKQRISA